MTRKKKDGKARFLNFMGRRQGDIFDDPGTWLGCRLWLERILGYYGEDGGVDVEIVEGQLGLCKQTADYLYSEFTPLETRYVRGFRPMLERIVAGTVKKGMTERQQALALMRRCRDARDHGVKVEIDGGTEEELLKRGGGMCNEISRVFICLCQIAGLPARTYSAHISGHMMAEVYADGKWGWIDPMLGLAPVTERDEPASAWELLQDSRLFERQPRAVWSEVRPTRVLFGRHERDRRNVMYIMARFRDFYFNPREAAALGNYYVWEHARYTYPWRNRAADPERMREAIRQEARNRKALGWPDYFFDPMLFAETIPMRRKRRLRTS
jgi:hypothetical protein